MHGCGGRLRSTDSCERVGAGPHRGRAHFAGNGRGNCQGGPGGLVGVGIRAEWGCMLKGL